MSSSRFIEVANSVQWWDETTNDIAIAQFDEEISVLGVSPRTIYAFNAGERITLPAFWWFAC